MKRLTERDEFGNADIIALSDVMPDIYDGLNFLETNALTYALNRLADYEDLGLEPKEIKDALKLLDEYKNLGTIDEIMEVLVCQAL